MKMYDKDNQVRETSGKHTVSSYGKDMNVIISILKREKLLEYLQGRHHHTFQNITFNPISPPDFEELVSWMYRYLKYHINGF
jgi:hypothetical protein